jgi:hypothetical protein
MKILFMGRYRLLVTLNPQTQAAVATRAAVTGCQVLPMRSAEKLAEHLAEGMARMSILVNHQRAKFGMALWCRQRSTAG